MLSRQTIALFLLLLAKGVSGAVLTSTAAGYANSLHPNCAGDSGNSELEIGYNAFNACVRHGVVEFSLDGTGITAVSAATLTLYNGFVGNWSPATVSIDLYGYAGDGQVTGGDFDLGTYFGTAIWDRSNLPIGPLTVDVTAFVNTQLALGIPIVGINLRAPVETSYCCLSTFLAFDGALLGQAPTLSLTAVPIPATVWLFGSGLVLLGWVRKPLVRH